MTTEIGALDSQDFYLQLSGINSNTCLWNGHDITPLDGFGIKKSIASRIQSLRFSEKSDLIECIRAAGGFAYKRESGRGRDLTQRDVAEIFNTPEDLLAEGQEGRIISIGLGKSTRKFCKKHKKTILIVAAVVAVVATVVIIAVSAGGAAAGVAAAAAGAAGSAAEQGSCNQLKAEIPPANNSSNTGDSFPYVPEQTALAGLTYLVPEYKTSNIPSNPFEQFLPSQELGKFNESLASNPVNQPFSTTSLFPLKGHQFQAPGTLYSIPEQNHFSSISQPPVVFNPGQTINPLSVSEFSLGFAKGLPKGVYESGHGLLLFAADFVMHPIKTCGQIIDSVTALASLVRNDEWGTVAEALSPEMHHLVTQWDTLPSDKRGELAGYAVGKHGADILVPGALVKISSKSVKSAQELAAICKNLQLAEEVLVLETAAGIVNKITMTEAVRSGQTMMALGEDVGLTAREMAQLKQAGKLESAINGGLEQLVSQSESEVLKAAINQNRHVKMVRDYLDKPAKEIQKGINSYEKQIVLHKDKISNPAKHYPDWDKLDPRQREALVNKKWPAEIQGYEEQKNVLQSILNERLSYE